MITAKQKEDWIAALRSGKYQQGAGALRRADETFCCLGVLADVIDPEGWGEGWDDMKKPYRKDAYVWHGFWFAALPERMLTTKAMTNLVFMNDDVGKSFAEIADWIENGV